MNKNIIIIFVLSGMNLFSQVCGDPIYCDPAIKYPYIQCFGKTAKIVCSDSPLTLNPKIIFAKMPICLDIVWKDSPGTIKLPTTIGEEIVFDNSTFANDVMTALYDWNCICGKQNTPCSQGCRMKIRFISNEKELLYKNDPAQADSKWSFPHGTTNCTFDCAKSEIRMNNTKGFKGKLINGYYENNFCNSNSSYYLQANSTYATWNILTIIKHEIGHLLGLHHFNKNMCNGTIPEITSNSVMNSSLGSDAPPKELSIYDKCAVAKLHCPSVTPVEEIQIDDDQTSTYPNPASEYITIQTSEVLKTLQVMEIKIFNTLGECVMTETIHPMTQKQQLNVESLPRGLYYIRIGNRTQIFVKE